MNKETQLYETDYPENIRQYLRDYAKKVAELRISSDYAAKNYYNANKLAGYMSSSPLRYSFGTLMCIAYYDDHAMSAQHISKMLDVSRQTATGYINETLPERWIERKSNGYMATEGTVKIWEDYVAKVYTPLVTQLDIVESCRRWQDAVTQYENLGSEVSIFIDRIEKHFEEIEENLNRQK